MLAWKSSWSSEHLNWVLKGLKIKREGEGGRQFEVREMEYGRDKGDKMKFYNCEIDLSDLANEVC